MGRGRPHKCPYCEATKSVAKGFRYNRSGKVRLRRCKACGRRWTVGTVQEEEIADPPQPVRIDGQENPPALQEAEAAGHEETSTVADHATDRTEDRDQDSEATEEDRSIELSLSGEESPSHENPGKEGEEESEETLSI